MCDGCEGAVVAGNDGDGGGEYEPFSTKGDAGAEAGAEAGGVLLGDFLVGDGVAGAGAGAGAGLAGAGAGAGAEAGAGLFL